jgi:hypothetical protein
MWYFISSACILRCRRPVGHIGFVVSGCGHDILHLCQKGASAVEHTKVGHGRSWLATFMLLHIFTTFLLLAVSKLLYDHSEGTCFLLFWLVALIAVIAIHHVHGDARNNGHTWSPHWYIDAICPIVISIEHGKVA